MVKKLAQGETILLFFATLELQAGHCKEAYIVGRRSGAVPAQEWRFTGYGGSDAE